MNNIKISIAILSYNHENFIEKAINSVLSQKLSYNYELLLYDDASTDKTQEILKNYYNKYPNIIKLFLFSENKGPVFRAYQIYQNCKGDYITWLDADDYWIYNSKLQIQLDFLEKNKNYCGAFHDAFIKTIEYSNNNLQAKLQSLSKYRYYSQFNKYEESYSPNLLITRNILPTASLVFRNKDFHDFFKKFRFQIFSFSWAFQLEIIKHGNFKYFNRCWSVYLDHENGLSKKYSNVKFTLNNINILKSLKKDKFYKNFKTDINNCILKEYECIVYDKITNKIVFKFMVNYLWFYLLTFLWTSLFYKYRWIKQTLKIK